MARVEQWNELVFVSLNNDVESLAERFAGIESHLGKDFFPGFKRDCVARQEKTEMNVNWKLLTENAIDGYPIFKVHPKTLQPSTPTKEAFFVDGNRNWSLSGIGETAHRLHSNGKVGSIGEFKANAMLFLALPPAFTLLISTDWVAWQLIDPLGLNQTHQYTGMSMNPTSSSWGLSKEEKAFYANADKANREDAIVLDLVQRGSSARLTRVGALVPPIEDAIGYLHEYIAANLIESRCRSVNANVERA